MRENIAMTKLYIEAQTRLSTFHAARRRFLAGLRTNRRGTVSWEYILVAAIVVVAVGTAFGPGKTGAIEAALAGGITTIITSFTGFAV
jgi:pilus assembly protein Flp/PilA